jgi:hypothetical protein
VGSAVEDAAEGVPLASRVLTAVLVALVWEATTVEGGGAEDPVMGDDGRGRSEGRTSSTVGPCSGPRRPRGARGMVSSGVLAHICWIVGGDTETDGGRRSGQGRRGPGRRRGFGAACGGRGMDDISGAARLARGGEGERGRTMVHGWSTLESYRVVEI